MPYQFAYEVKDDPTTNYQNRVEFVENGVLQGSYSLLAPDGVVRTWIYSDDVLLHLRCSYAKFSHVCYV